MQKRCRFKALFFYDELERKGFIMHKENNTNDKRKFQGKHLWISGILIVLILCFFCTVFRLSGAHEEEHFISLDRSENPDSSNTVPEEKPVLSVRSGTSSPKNEWNLILVNPWNPLSEDYSVSVTRLDNGQAIDSRCYSDLQDMMDACRAEGLSPLICSSYRTWEKQETLYNDQINELILQGYSKEEAASEAATMVAVPGTSEHQLGLAVDIVDKNYQLLEEAQENTAVQKWLMQHSWEYGFILRYPKDKSEITGIIYEPWHYRYVGKEAAKEITENGICLEEYIKEYPE